MTINNDARTLLFVDGPNIDATLGNSVLERKPSPQERPRWNRIIQFAKMKLGVDESWFVLNGDRFGLECTSFYRCLKHVGFKVAIPKRSECCQHHMDDPVDEWIKMQLACVLDKIRLREVSGVVVFTHDGGFAPALKAILDAGGSVTIIGFLEWMAPSLVDLRDCGAAMLDLEHDVGGFDRQLDRPKLHLD